MNDSVLFISTAHETKSDQNVVFLVERLLTLTHHTTSHHTTSHHTTSHHTHNTTQHNTFVKDEKIPVSLPIQGNLYVQMKKVAQH